MRESVATVKRDCPFAKKKAIYRTKRAAWRDIRGDMGRPPPEGYDLRPFKCQCGGWHVSSKEFVALRVRRDARTWTVFTKQGRVGLHIRGPNHRGIAVEWTRRDLAVLIWAFVKASVRA